MLSKLGKLLRARRAALSWVGFSAARPAATLLLLSAITSAADGRAVTLRLRPALDRPSTRFEGWGTALAWFANVTGGWPKGDRENLADLLYGKDGLGWTIARYNIGGGNAPTIKPYLRTGAAVPGFWHQPAGQSGSDWWNPNDERMWDWSQDRNQRWWLEAVRRRVRHPIFEAFSNSPPWFMTVSGRVSGALNGNDDNLRPGFERVFAAYLARVVDELQRRQGIAFRTLSPFNEPNTDYWYASNRQEGSHWSPKRQVAMIDATDRALKMRGLATRVAAPDETNSSLMLQDFTSYPASTRARIDQLNVHSYGTTNQTRVREAARAAGIRLWMSENDTPLRGDPEDFQRMSTPLVFAEHVVMDLKRLEPAAWVFWQAVEDLSARGGPGSNWGLIKADLRSPAAGPHQIYITKKYWAMAQFSRFIRPGDRLLPIDDIDTVAALSPKGNRLVLVHVNAGNVPRHLILPVHWQTQMIVTDGSRNSVAIHGTTAPARSIVTLILTRRPALARGHRKFRTHAQSRELSAS